jgi:hypothetical protein
MIERTFDIDYVNGIANHPEVRPWLGADLDGSFTSYVDCSPYFQNDKVQVFAAPGGIFSLVEIGPVDYEVHLGFLPNHRGANARQAIREFLQHVFTQTPCETLHAALPDYNRPVKVSARAMGFRRGPSRTTDWSLMGGAGEDWLITRQAWRGKAA